MLSKSEGRLMSLRKWDSEGMDQPMKHKSEKCVSSIPDMSSLFQSDNLWHSFQVRRIQLLRWSLRAQFGKYDIVSKCVHIY